MSLSLITSYIDLYNLHIYTYLYISSNLPTGVAAQWPLGSPGHEDELYRALLQLSLQGLDPWPSAGEVTGMVTNS